jgi:peptidoglycan/LPS O-acetylase OafA/YrhL
MRPTAISKTIWMWLGSISLIALFSFYRDEVGLVQIMLILLIFIAAIQATGPWAILRWRPVRYLGHISYSIYLLHNPLIHVFAKWGFGLSRYGAFNQPELYGAAFLIGLGVIAVSTVTFVFIEKPFFYR